MAVALRNLGAVLIAVKGAEAAASALDEAAILFVEFDDPAAHRHRAEVDALRRDGEDDPATL